MKRKPIYLLLAAPILLFVVYLVVLPGSTRATFLAEFKHRTKVMFFGEEPLPDQGLRLQSPEEYGLAPQSENDSQPSEVEPGQGRGEFDPTQIFNQTDTDENGVLEGEEIGERMRENFELIDADGDGKVAKQEFLDYIQQRREEWSAAQEADESTSTDTVE